MLSDNMISESISVNSYQIEVVETLSKTITVNAKDESSAMQKVKESYKLEEFVLDSNNYVETDFVILNADKDNATA